MQITSIPPMEKRPESGLLSRQRQAWEVANTLSGMEDSAQATNIQEGATWLNGVTFKFQFVVRRAGWTLQKD
jgi:hypothetical protein